jgi:hypothetical protein
VFVQQNNKNLGSEVFNQNQDTSLMLQTKKKKFNGLRCLRFTTHLTSPLKSAENKLEQTFYFGKLLRWRRLAVDRHEELHEDQGEFVCECPWWKKILSNRASIRGSCMLSPAIHEPIGQGRQNPSGIPWGFVDQRI